MITRFSRILMLAVATLWLLMPLHFAAEEHRWCGEHSDFEHGDSADLLVAPPSTDDEASWQASARPENGNHHQCLIIYLLERTPSLQGTQAVVSTHLPPSHAPAHAGAFTVPSVPRVAVAPKTSPPSA